MKARSIRAGSNPARSRGAAQMSYMLFPASDYPCQNFKFQWENRKKCD